MGRLVGRALFVPAWSVTRITRGIDRETLMRQPSLMTIVNSNSPLRLDGPMSEGLIEMATFGQPVVATPFTLAGAMTPARAHGIVREADLRRRAAAADGRGARALPGR